MRYILLASVALLLGACQIHDPGPYSGPRYYAQPYSYSYYAQPYHYYVRQPRPVYSVPGRHAYAHGHPAGKPHHHAKPHHKAKHHHKAKRHHGKRRMGGKGGGGPHR